MVFMIRLLSVETPKNCPENFENEHKIKHNIVDYVPNAFINLIIKIQLIYSLSATFV